MPRVTVFYEDSLDSKIKEFGLHKLVVRCVVDDLNQEFWSIAKAVDGQPHNGSSKLRKACQEKLPLIGRPDCLLVAVYDRDKLHKLVSPGPCKSSTVAALKEGCEPADRLRCVLLESNLETVLQTLRGFRASLVSSDSWDDAILRKDLLQRDRVLNAASRVANLDVRQHLREQMKSFDYLIEKIVFELRRSPA